jgi:hypothetical protein
MVKILPYIPELFAPRVYICHWGTEGPYDRSTWHQIFDGVEDDIYWAMLSTGFAIVNGEPEYLPMLARTLASLPEIPHDMCPACRYLYQPFTFAMPHIPRWNIYRGPEKYCPPAIYWPPSIHGEEPPPGYHWNWE